MNNKINVKNLTQSQITVLHFVSKGMSNKEIGNELGISEHTVRAHLSTIMDRLGAFNRVEAIVRAYEYGINFGGKINLLELQLKATKLLEIINEIKPTLEELCKESYINETS